ncbi:MAG: rRNA maturation RNase YbeY [Patescibacteria group bacterium]
MIWVSFYKQSNYPVDSKLIKGKVIEVLKKNGLTSDYEVSLAIVGEKLMDKLVKKYFNDNASHAVLSFPTSEIKGRFIFPPGSKNYLGEIIISFNQARDSANKTNRRIDEIVSDLAIHGAMHLIGIHHD